MWIAVVACRKIRHGGKYCWFESNHRALGPKLIWNSRRRVLQATWFEAEGDRYLSFRYDDDGHLICYSRGSRTGEGAPSDSVVTLHEYYGRKGVLLGLQLKIDTLGRHSEWHYWKGKSVRPEELDRRARELLRRGSRER